jgi:hypothetical protein
MRSYQRNAVANVQKEKRQGTVQDNWVFDKEDTPFRKLRVPKAPYVFRELSWVTQRSQLVDPVGALVRRVCTQVHCAVLDVALRDLRRARETKMNIQYPWGKMQQLPLKKISQPKR